MNTIDIQSMTIDQLKADFASIMGEVVIQYGDDGREQEQDQMSVSRLPVGSRVGIDDYEQREIHLL